VNCSYPDSAEEEHVKTLLALVFHGLAQKTSRHAEIDSMVFLTRREKRMTSPDGWMISRGGEAGVKAPDRVAAPAAAGGLDTGRASATLWL
jgi:hypothetical protein